ncbi:TetR family transcriptional regulator [Microbacterium lushaniae]|nr:TetR/AcrR family transcriptional regulator C-terminal domain-containing protein [Microbacterium lushaniae]
MAGLTRKRILDCAVAMADRDGLDAVTLRRIAADLGVHVTSLYNHVETRDAITDGIVDVLLDQAHLPVTPVDWEEWVRTFFAAMSDLATRHPGAFAALSRRPVQGARAAASFEVAMAAFARAGLSAGDAYSAVKAAVFATLGVGAERSMSARDELPETVMEDLPLESFPQFHALQDHDPTLAWSFSLETLVAGLRAQIAERASAGG